MEPNRNPADGDELGLAALLLASASLIVVPVGGIVATILDARAAAGVADPGPARWLWAASMAMPASGLVLASASARRHAGIHARIARGLAASVLALACAATASAWRSSSPRSAAPSPSPVPVASPTPTPTPIPTPPTTIVAVPTPTPSPLRPSSRPPRQNPSPQPMPSPAKPSPIPSPSSKPSLQASVWQEPSGEVTAGPLVEVESAAAAPRRLFAFRGEPDPSWRPEARGKGVVFGPESRTDRPIELPRIAAALGSAGLALAPHLAAVIDGDGASVTIYRAGAEDRPASVRLSAPASQVAIAGSRLVVGHAGRPFVSIVDADGGAVLRELTVPGAVTNVLVPTSVPRLALLHAGASIIGLDVARLELLESASLGRVVSRLLVGGDARYLYGQDPGPGPCVWDSWCGLEPCARSVRATGLGPDAAGRFVFSSRAILRAGLVTRAGAPAGTLLGTLSNGNLLGYEPPAQADVDSGTASVLSGSLVFVDGRTAKLLKRGSLTRNLGDVDEDPALIPGTDRLLIPTGRGLVYRDLEPVGQLFATARRLELQRGASSTALIGRPWTLPVDVSPPDAPNLSVNVVGPRGMVYDPAARAVVWTPTETGTRLVNVTISADGYEDLLVSTELMSTYPRFELPQGAIFGGVLPSERWVFFWPDPQGPPAIVFRDPVRGVERRLATHDPVTGVAEIGSRVYLAVGSRNPNASPAERARGRVVELDGDTLEPVRERQHGLGRIEAILASPDGKAIDLAFARGEVELVLARLPLDDGAPDVRPIPDSGGAAKLVDRPASQRPVLCWVDGERLAVSCEYGMGPLSRLYRWGPTALESAGTIPDCVRSVVRGERPVLFGSGSVRELDGRVLVEAPRSAILPSTDGTYFLVCARYGRDVTARFFALPGGEERGSVTFATGAGLGEAWLLARGRSLLVSSGTGFLLLPFDLEALLRATPVSPR